MIEFTGQEMEKNTLKLLKKIAKYTLKIAGQKPRKLELGVDFVHDDEILELNKRMRNINNVTDVLSFPNLTNQFNKKINKKTFPKEVNPENKKVYIGDVVINLNKVEEQAGDYGHSFNRELSYLMVHGIFHLLGYDHEDALDAKLMRAQEEKALAKFNLKKLD